MRRWMVGVIGVGGLGLGLGCDGALVGEPTRGAVTPIAPAPAVPELEPIAAPDELAATIALTTILETRQVMSLPQVVAPQGNVTCEAAVPLGDRGAVDVPVAGGARGGEGCFAYQGPTRFFRVTVGPREVVDVRLVNAQPLAEGVWLSAAPSCDAVAEACWEGWTWAVDGAVLANDSDTPSERIVAAVATTDTRTERFDLEVTRTPLAANASCAGALPLAPGATLGGQALAGGGVPGPDSLRRVLYYSVEVPALSRVKATITSEGPTPMYGYFVDDCSVDLQLARDEAANLGDAPRTLTLAVGTFWQEDEGAFAVSVETTPIAPEARCDEAVEVAPGAPARVDTEAGGPGPSACWCLLPTRAVHVDVTVPAGETLELVATVVGAEGSDEHGRVDLVELGDACATECSQNAAFGWGGEARLTLTNAGTTAAVRQVLVSGTAGWDADPRAPEVDLAVRPLEPAPE